MVVCSYGSFIFVAMQQCSTVGLCHGSLNPPPACGLLLLLVFALVNSAVQSQCVSVCLPVYLGVSPGGLVTYFSDIKPPHITTWHVLLTGLRGRPE